MSMEMEPNSSNLLAEQQKSTNHHRQQRHVRHTCRTDRLLAVAALATGRRNHLDANLARRQPRTAERAAEALRANARAAELARTIVGLHTEVGHARQVRACALRRRRGAQAAGVAAHAAQVGRHQRLVQIFLWIVSSITIEGGGEVGGGGLEIK